MSVIGEERDCFYLHLKVTWEDEGRRLLVEFGSESALIVIVSSCHTSSKVAYGT